MFSVYRFVAILAVASLGCLPEIEDPTVVDEGENSDTAAVTYKKDVQPIFKAKCTPCHDSGSELGGQGGHDIASDYADVHHKAMSFDAMGCFSGDLDNPVFVTLGECAVISARRGWMPQAKACDMPTPPNPSVCVSASELAVLEKWVSLGMPE
jgi:hypothetical protein